MASLRVMWRSTSPSGGSEELSSGPYPPIRPHETISVIPDFTPGQLRRRLAGIQWNGHWSKFDPQPDIRSVLGQFARDKKFIIPKTAVGGLDNMFRGPQLLF